MASDIPSDDIETARLIRHGFALHAQDQLSGARAAYEQVLQRQPGHPNALYLLAALATQMQDHARVVTLMDEAIARQPDDPVYAMIRGNALLALEDHVRAVIDYDTAIARNPDNAKAWSHRGVALKKLGRLDAAIASYQQAVALEPDAAGDFFNLGLALGEAGRQEEAAAAYDQAIFHKPDFAQALSNRGAARRELQRLDEGLADVEKAIAIKPDYAEAWCNRGLLQSELGRLDAAIADYDQAIAVQPDYAPAHFNKSLALLAKADFARGWEAYEWRFRLADSIGVMRQFREPHWLGATPLAGKTILLHAEQGLGDTIIFSRYVAPVRDLGARVILEAPKALTGVLGGIEGITVIEHGQERSPFDYHCPLMSLPLALRSWLPEIPAATPYLHADAEKAAFWKKRIAACSGGKRPRIGVAWSSGIRPGAPSDNRAIPLELFCHHLNRLDADFFSLQKGQPAEDEIKRRQGELWPLGNFHNFMDEDKSLSDTAAIIANLDLMICMDTSVTHLSCALGKPTWVLLKCYTEWRWQLDREDSLWHPTARVYRQAADYRWEPVLQRVASDLEKFAHDQG